MVCCGLVMAHNGAVMVYDEAVMVYDGSVMVYDGAVMVYNGAVMVYDGAVMGHHGGKNERNGREIKGFLMEKRSPARGGSLVRPGGGHNVPVLALPRGDKVPFIALPRGGPLRRAALAATRTQKKWPPGGQTT